MGKISKQVSKGLGAAIKEAQAKMTGQVVTNINDPDDIENVNMEDVEVSLDVNQLLESGVTAQKKRKKGVSKAETTEEPKEESRMRTHEEVCADDLRKAVERGYPEPDFDFRNHYETKSKAYYVRILAALGEKEVIPVTLRTIYPRMMVGSQEKGMCHCIGYSERGQVFMTLHEANAYAKTIKLTQRHSDEESPKKRRNHVVEEEDGDTSAAYPNMEDDDED